MRKGAGSAPGHPVIALALRSSQAFDTLSLRQAHIQKETWGDTPVPKDTVQDDRFACRRPTRPPVRRGHSMTTSLDLSSVIATAVARRGLKPRSDLNEIGWTFWELRTLNRHRAVGLLKEGRKFADVHDLGEEIRSSMSGTFKRSWWRGFAYGVVAELSVIPWSPTDLEPLVNLYESSKGVLQWAILVDLDNRTAIGVHTWLEVYLSPAYREILQALAANGYQVTRAVRGMDGLWTFLTDVSELKGVEFPEYHDSA
jgi:hypothetical protein